MVRYQEEGEGLLPSSLQMEAPLVTIIEFNQCLSYNGN